jgi:hypothetical protein
MHRSLKWLGWALLTVGCQTAGDRPAAFNRGGGATQWRAPIVADEPKPTGVEVDYGIEPVLHLDPAAPWRDHGVRGTIGDKYKRSSATQLLEAGQAAFDRGDIWHSRQLALAACQRDRGVHTPSMALVARCDEVLRARGQDPNDPFAGAVAEVRVALDAAVVEMRRLAKLGARAFDARDYSRAAECFASALESCERLPETFYRAEWELRLSALAHSARYLAAQDGFMRDMGS